MFPCSPLNSSWTYPPDRQIGLEVLQSGQRDLLQMTPDMFDKILDKACQALRVYFLLGPRIVVLFACHVHDYPRLWEWKK